MRLRIPPPISVHIQPVINHYAAPVEEQHRPNCISLFICVAETRRCKWKQEMRQLKGAHALFSSPMKIAFASSFGALIRRGPVLELAHDVRVQNVPRGNGLLIGSVTQATG